MILAALLTVAWQAASANLLESAWYGSDAAKAVRTDITAPNGAPGFRFALPEPGNNPTWDINCVQPVNATLKTADRLSFSFLARSSSSNKVNAYLQLGTPPYTDSFSNVFTLTPEWKTYVLEGAPDREFAPRAASLGFHLNYGKGVVEIADFKLVRVQPRAPGNLSLATNGKFESPLGSAWQPTATKFAVVDAKGPTFRRALHLEVVPVPDMQPWTFNVHAPTTNRIEAGDAISVKAWMRSPTGSQAGVHMEKASEPYNKFVSTTARLTPQWQEVVVAGVAPADYAAGAAQLTLFLGYGKGTIEVSDVRVVNHGKVPISALKLPINYFGTEKANDAWRPAALARIEKYRKGDLIVRVTHRGKPVANAEVRVSQVRQAFHFGTAAPASLIVNDATTNGKFRKTLFDNFNTVTFENDLKWFSLTPPDYRDTDAAVKMLQKAGFAIRGHNVVWGSRRNLPAGLWEKSNDEIRAILAQRTKDSVGRFQGIPYVWDVVNEAVSERELWERLGWDEFVKMYKLARAADPKVKLAYNDYDITEEAATGTKHKEQAVELVKLLKRKGAPVDIFGLQCHLNLPLTTIPRVLEILDELGKLPVELEVTEFDLGAFDDAFHGKYTADYLTAMYSHPKVTGFIMWGFWAGAHWRASEGGAMIRPDWTFRPAMTAWHDLVRKQWWTNVTTKTNAQGMAKTRAFFGDLEVRVKGKVQRVALPSGRREITIEI